ncbi:hypothetical protein PCC8801_1070 [Rippkaea orientalis PCC 8801]|uniref:PEP-CTERM protein-sorting domain-containing protein n=1 Tax=Rippkaea orientalis (strain PCC 8801 / RF-1) TaxID=41431 RepID=B7K104_RIPO1|nr:PEP-CTERM sorting domain-containing protein [Rippkaea orientalis]ACK65145.1 hypothetical protein PCC8801_1070 [Rippkaea orientalis PCC 8801]
MNNQITPCSSLTKTVSNLGMGCLTTVTILMGMTGKTHASVINFDADQYRFSNPNTCTPQLAPDNKCFVEDGVNVEAFSARQTGGDPGHFHEGGHFHASNSYEAQHYTAGDNLLGVKLTLANGGSFDLVSLDYQLRNIASGIINGFTADDIKILITTNFNPTEPVLGQFVEYSIGNDITQPFQTLSLTTFENMTQVYIASSAGVNFDNITLAPIPEPSLLLGLLTLGSFGVISKSKRQQISKRANINR